MSHNSTDGWIQTLDGSQHFLAEPRPSLISPRTLAICLSRICRFGGHPLKFYSVGQHSILVYKIVSRLTNDTNTQLAALLHDAHEAYDGFGDICRPAKHLDPNVYSFLKSHQDRHNLAIAERFCIQMQDFDSDHIKIADNIALATEARDLMTSPPEPWNFLPDPLPKRIKPKRRKKVVKEFLSIVQKLRPLLEVE